FVLHLALETPERALNRLAVLDVNFGQSNLPVLLGHERAAPCLPDAIGNRRTIHPALLHQRIRFSSTLPCILAHILFRESEAARPGRILTPLQQGLAQEWQFLHADVVSPSQGKIGSDQTRCPRSILLDLFKREYAESHILCEPRENESHISLLPNVARSRGLR